MNHPPAPESPQPGLSDAIAQARTIIAMKVAHAFVLLFRKPTQSPSL